MLLMVQKSGNKDLGCIKTLSIKAHLPYQLVSRISEPSTVGGIISVLICENIRSDAFSLTPDGKSKQMAADFQKSTAGNKRSHPIEKENHLNQPLGDGFKYFLFSPLLGEIIQFD